MAINEYELFGKKGKGELANEAEARRILSGLPDTRKAANLILA